MINKTHDKKQEFLSFDAALEQTKLEIDHILLKSPSLVRSYTMHLLQARGKLIRACSTLSCSMNQNDLIPSDGISLAAAIELLHLATLVHDDIIDDAELRRGFPTLQKKYGKKTAVICGDYLLAVALRTAASLSERKKPEESLYLPDYLNQICMGELRQNLNNGNLDLSMYRYLSIINGKTAALFEAAFYGGALLCENNPALLKQYRRLGRYIGIIFQLTDDCIDYEMDETTAGKNVQTDFEQGVITLPLIYTFQKNCFFKEKAKKKLLCPNEVSEAVLESGGLKYTHYISKRYFIKANSLLNLMNLSLEKKEQLTKILEKSYYGSQRPPL